MKKRQNLFSLFLVSSLLFFSCNKEEVSQNESTDSNAKTDNTQVRQGPGAGDWNTLCTGSCIQGGWSYIVYQHINNGTIKYEYLPISGIWVNQNHQNNPSTIPDAYNSPGMIAGPMTSGSVTQTLDFEGNPIIGLAYRYNITPGHNVFFGNPWISTAFATGPLSGVVDACNINTARFYLNNNSNKPAVGNIICTSGSTTGGGISQTNWGDDKWKPAIILTNVYGKLCFEEEPGFCFDDGGIAPPEPQNPNVGPAAYDYVDSHTLRVSFYRDVIDNSIVVTSEGNNLSDKVIDWFELPENTTIVPQEYEIFSSGIPYDYGYVLIDLEY